MAETISYEYLYSMGNLTLAWRKARQGKSASESVIKFEKDLERNLLSLHTELKNKTYYPLLLATFILRDPKTRKISKSHFRDRVVHHALISVIGKKFQKAFIYDSCANQIGKGTSLALKRFDHFRRKVTKNNTRIAFCLKADIFHYFDEIDHAILLSILEDKISDKDIIWLIKQIVNNSANFGTKRERRITTQHKRHAARQLHLAILCECLSRQARPFCETCFKDKILHPLR